MDDIPRGRFKRSVVGSKTAARVGGKLLGYYAKRPFLSDEKKHRAKEQMEEESAAIVFQALSLLKGTAVKIAQMLSVEMDIFPESVCRELAKSYNQVPPMNQVMVKKTAGNAFNRPVEDVFKSFDTRAFAAASLGQVHRAFDKKGNPLAVKLQYPGIARSIKDDMQIVRHVLRPLSEYDTILPVLHEIEERLSEEIDYRKEADNIAWFSERMPENGFCIPEVKNELSTCTVLTMSYLKGKPLNEWLKSSPDQKARDTVAQRMYDWFLYCFYELNCIHADPNPGNFIIDDDLNVGVVDFGCVRHFNPDFIRRYRKLIRALVTKDKDLHIRMFREFDMIKSEPDPSLSSILKEIVESFCGWYGQLEAEEIFDFGANPDFMKGAKAVSRDIYKIRRHMKLNPNFVYLDRTRYGMLRLFEQMKAKVRIRNSYEQ